MAEDEPKDEADRGERSEALLEVALALARREFDTRVDLAALGDDSNFVELGATLNMLGEELEATTVTVDVLEQMNTALQKKNAELDEFTSLVSHDLQAPLRHIITFSDLLKVDLGDGLDEDTQENLDFLVDAAKRMRTLVQDLLAFSRSGRSDLRISKLPLSKCVEGALLALEEQIEEKNAQITCDVLPVVSGDQTLLTQLFQNLIGNAMKFSPVERPTVHVTAEKIDDKSVFGVKDAGIGIEEKYMTKIFKPFSRLHGGNEFEGTGIGLAICSKVVERHAGRLWVESEVGKGSHFKFTLGERLRKRHGTG